MFVDQFFACINSCPDLERISCYGTIIEPSSASECFSRAQNEPTKADSDEEKENHFPAEVKKSKRLLRHQVKDFVDWLKAQGAI